MNKIYALPPVIASFSFLVIASPDLSGRGNPNPAATHKGWAFIAGEDFEDSETYLVLKSADNTYIFDTVPEYRDDVTRAYKDLELNLDWSGFWPLLPLRNVASGEYIIGIYIKKGDIEALQYTDKAIVKSKDTVKLSQRLSDLQELSLPLASSKIWFHIDSLEQVLQDGKELVEIRRWSFIEGHDSINSRIYLVLKSDDNTYVFDSFLQNPPA